jgi:hypothetical protein
MKHWADPIGYSADDVAGAVQGGQVEPGQAAAVLVDVEDDFAEGVLADSLLRTCMLQHAPTLGVS